MDHIRLHRAGSLRSGALRDRSEAPEQLLPVDRHHLLATLSFALTRDSKLPKTQAADVMASVVSTRLRKRVNEAMGASAAD